MQARGETRTVTVSGPTLRVGFIGADFSARLYAEAYHPVRGVDVVLTRVAATRPERAEMLRRALASGDEILAACCEAGVRLCYAENWVYAPPIQRARRLLTTAGGPILRIVGEESQGGTSKAPARSEVAPLTLPSPPRRGRGNQDRVLVAGRTDRPGGRCRLAGRAARSG